MADQSNYIRGRAARELAAIALRREGLDDARHRVPPRRLSERIAQLPEDRSDITGIENWHVSVAADLHNRWAERLDAATSTAALAGVPNAAVIQVRRDADSADWYAVLDLRTFARLVAETQRTGALA